jgi:hypothetical protein
MMKLKDAMQRMIAAVEQEDMVVMFALEFAIKRMKLEIALIDAREKVEDMETPPAWDGRFRR